LLKGLTLSRRSSAIVDLGPIHLRSGGEDQSCESLLERASVLDVARLEAILNGSGMPNQQTNDYSDEQLNFYIANVSESDEKNRLDKLGQELLMATEHITTRASLELQGDSLKGLHLTVFEMEGRLHFELVSKDEKHRMWLSHQIQNLANEVGDRLQRSIRIQLLVSNENESMAIRADWNESKDS
jgi:hypothetical protein